MCCFPPTDLHLHLHLTPQDSYLPYLPLFQGPLLDSRNLCHDLSSSHASVNGNTLVYCTTAQVHGSKANRCPLTRALIMDQRQSAQHPYSRPQPQPLSRDVRYAPIPPPPYSSQSVSARQELPQQNGPFLQQRNDIDRTRTPPVTDQNRPYRHPMTSQYPPNPFSASRSPVADYNHNHPRRGSKGSGAEYGNGSGDRYKPYGAEGMSKTVCGFFA